MAYNKETGMYEGFIYKITNTVNDKCYIGQTIVDIELRFRRHISDSNANKDDGMYIHKAIKKYGAENFSLLELVKVESLDLYDLQTKLNNLECHYIEELSTLVPNGYNITRGGNNISEKMKIPVDQYTKDGIYIATYNSVANAMINTTNKLDGYSLISKCCKGQRCTAYGYVWRYCGEPFDKYSVVTKRQYPVDVYSRDGIFIGSYRGILEGLRELNLPESSHVGVGRCCNGEIGISCGYVWRHKGDPFDKYNCGESSRGRIINQYTLDDFFIFSYENSVLAAKSIGKNNACYISRKIQGNHSAYGFKWYYADDPNQPDKTKIINNAAQAKGDING